MNVTVCLSQATTANFTCVVVAGSTPITSVGWQILTGGFYVTVIGRSRHMLDPRISITNSGTTITETLTVTNVSLSDNGAKYRCRPLDDVVSDVVTLTVIGMYLDCCKHVIHTYVSKITFILFACVCQRRSNKT